MPPLASLLPTLPWQILEIIIKVVAILGAILLTYGIFLKTEKRQDIFLFIGAFCLFIYALYLGNFIFMLAMTGLGLSSFVEFVEILIGLHKERKNQL
ncbi:MAG: hypothetical protein COU31_02845 [Candidatus Magasanikbacteria bacterium CG10_big_fil_rev_8_21_14_0_10_40_10]|uniref:Uncharacterized protein n=1 Tax=Candidatus Magasanikbacteria bacterium CG10_big_fil_rev_8_21_14_0_10_40_10 TaxID=1974648 RepID=A0A2M6W3W9_9BACT|nr:MAG: hypothetical protein COU31_02845 [Candidatus Magasanikbacteria bacterium CG10_big_fil_rev_8_21_14_0_10_40_10]